jgi:hypothetical protein
LMLASPLPGWQELRSFGTVLKEGYQSILTSFRAICHTGHIPPKHQRYEAKIPPCLSAYPFLP